MEFLAFTGLLFAVLYLISALSRKHDHDSTHVERKLEVKLKPLDLPPRNLPPLASTKPSKKTEHAPPPPIPTSRKLKGRAYVIDGDTIVVQKIKVRLAGIDAPELDQPWGQKSKWEMVRICKGQTLTVELTGETSYDRLVGTCYLPDGRDIGAEIVKAGLALDGGYYSKGKYRHLEQPGTRSKLIRYGHRGKRS